MSEIPKPPHDKEQDATRANERLQGIERSQQESGTDLNQQFLPDPAEETGAKSLGGGYETAPPPEPPKPKYLSDQLPTDEHKEAARRNLPAARKALEDARNSHNPTPPNKPNTP